MESLPDADQDRLVHDAVAAMAAARSRARRGRPRPARTDPSAPRAADHTDERAALPDAELLRWYARGTHAAARS